MSEKIKLLVVADTYYPMVDGTLKFVEEFVKRAGKDFDYHLLVPNFKDQKDTPRVTFVKVSRFIKLSGYHSIKIFSLSNFRKISKAVKENDIIFVQGPVFLSALSILIGKLKKKKVVFYMHVDLWNFFKNVLVTPILKVLYFFMKPFVKILGNNCSLVLVPYRDLIDTLKAKKVNVPVKVVHLGVDINKFFPVKDKNNIRKKLSLPQEKMIIGYVGRVSNEKNTHTLLEAFKKLPQQNNLHLLIVGDGSVNLVKELKSISNCTVTGFVRNVEDYYQAMDIFVMPSLTETTSLATLEAMSTGLPVIATKVGFIKEYLSKEHNGLFFPRNSSGMLAVKLEQLLNSPALREKLGHNARKTVAYSFSWERSINKIKRIFLEQL
ncbi:hypothetical protein COY27_05095 [Candidatus Woesearchaeota archaeon CG_4_10_14_0_2_um_filter_33_13]|nr:MAG: hypothetical protein COY27_05095 [Candidatus Woesearchaeota archaeon CG_4_10_14_0_2_um_filter_33_13]